MKKVFISILIFYILALLESSFFVHFDFFYSLPNFILILVVLINLLEKPKNSFGLWLAGIGGFFLDIFSTFSLKMDFVGFYILFLLTISVFIKVILKRYVRISILKRI